MAVSEMYEDDLEPGETLFHATAKQYSLWAALKSGMLSGFLIGYHGRLTNRRVQILYKTKFARELKAALTQLNDQQSSHFLGLATVNKEQAEAAFRYSAIINFTAPITLIVVINQIFPGFLSGALSNYLLLGPIEIGLVVALFIVAVITPVFQAYMSVAIARDIYHMGTIDRARRGGSRSDEAKEDTGASIDPGDF